MRDEAGSDLIILFDQFWIFIIVIWTFVFKLKYFCMQTLVCKQLNVSCNFAHYNWNASHSLFISDLRTFIRVWDSGSVVLYLPISQNFPLYPARQEHWKERLGAFRQVPPFWQGLGLHVAAVRAKKSQSDVHCRVLDATNVRVQRDEETDQEYRPVITDLSCRWGAWTGVCTCTHSMEQ